jgi:hypothetical protein
MRGLFAIALCVAPFLATCGGTEYGTLLVDHAALAAGAKVELVDSKGSTESQTGRVLPYRIAPGHTAIVSIGQREVSVEASPGSVVSVSGAALTVAKLEPRALQVTATEASARALASFIGASAEQLTPGVFLIKDGSSDLVSRAALASTDTRITDLRAVPVETVVPDPLPAPTLPVRGVRSAGVAVRTSPAESAALQPFVEQPAAVLPVAKQPSAVEPAEAMESLPFAPASLDVDSSKRFVQFYGYCGSWIPSPGAPFVAHFPDGSVATGHTDGLGLVLLDDAPSLNPELQIAGGIAGLPPRPYTLEPSQPKTFANVVDALRTSDITHLAWALQDAARLVRPEWADEIIPLLSHPHTGIRVLAAVALLRYSDAVQARALASLTDPKIQDDVAYVLGRKSHRPLPDVQWTSGVPVAAR